jgi:hypothetical protein
MFRDGFNSHASDIHIEPRPTTRLRCGTRKATRNETVEGRSEIAAWSDRS